MLTRASGAAPAGRDGTRIAPSSAMESRAFHICPFCQSPAPVSESRCARCRRSLVGLPLTVYGSELDAALARPAPTPLVDLPLRDTEPMPPGPLVPAPPATPRAARRRRGVGAAGPAGATAIMLLVIGAALVSGALVHGRRSPPRAHLRHAPAASRPAVATPIAAPLVARAASPRPRARASLPRRPPAMVAASPSAPSPRPSAPAARPAAQVQTLHPDVHTEPAGVQRASDTLGRDPGDPDLDQRDDRAAQAALRAQLRRAEERRDRLAERVDDLRERINVPVVTDVAAYQRLEDLLESTRSQLDRARADVARLHRALGERD